MRLGADKQECIGIHLAKGVEGLPNQDVDELMIVVRDEYSDSRFNVSLDGDNALVEVAVDVRGVAVYRLSKEEVSRLFKRPFKRDGSQRASIQNVDAPVEDLRRFLVATPATNGGSGN